MEMDRDSWVAELLIRINCTLYIVQYHCALRTPWLNVNSSCRHPPLSHCISDSLSVRNIILTIETSQNNHSSPRWSDIAVCAGVEIYRNRQKLRWFSLSRLLA